LTVQRYPLKGLRRLPLPLSKPLTSCRRGDGAHLEAQGLLPSQLQPWREAPPHHVRRALLLPPCHCQQALGAARWAGACLNTTRSLRYQGPNVQGGKMAQSLYQCKGEHCKFVGGNSKALRRYMHLVKQRRAAFSCGHIYSSCSSPTPFLRLYPTTRGGGIGGGGEIDLGLAPNCQAHGSGHEGSPGLLAQLLGVKGHAVQGGGLRQPHTRLLLLLGTPSHMPGFFSLPAGNIRLFPNYLARRTA